MRRIVGIVLAVLLMGGVVYAFLAGRNQDQGTATKTVRGDFTLLTSAPQEARESGRALTEYLRTPEAQRAITEKTFRRPVVASVRPATGLATGQRRELPFPGSRSVADGLLDAYENKLRRPSRTVYVLDTSGSMEGERMEGLEQALLRLTGEFREREEVTLMPFGTDVKSLYTHTLDPSDPEAARKAIERDVNQLTPHGDTAIFTSLLHAYRYLGQTPEGGNQDAFTSIVLMTDGENTTGASAEGFETYYRGLPPGQLRDTPVFPILFGDSDRAELERIAGLTGGRLFDAQKGSLDGAFEEIRGYQ